MTKHVKPSQTGRMTSFLVVILLCSLSFVEASDSILPCLPKDLSQETLVSSEGFKSASGEKQKGVTVGETLHLLEARCQESKLVDKTGREIYFFHLIGCWGNPPADYEERLALQAQEVQRLKKQYTVLEIPCAQRDPRLIQ